MLWQCKLQLQRIILLLSINIENKARQSTYRNGIFFPHWTESVFQSTSTSWRDWGDDSIHYLCPSAPWSRRPSRSLSLVLFVLILSARTVLWLYVLACSANFPTNSPSLPSRARELRRMFARVFVEFSHHPETWERGVVSSTAWQLFYFFRLIHSVE